jgi:outer membrane protein assembly factor BamD (BamD/ComL family)
MQLVGLLTLLALAATPVDPAKTNAGSDKSSTTPPATAAGEKQEPDSKKRVRVAAKKSAASAKLPRPEWLLASGLPASEEKLSPKAAEEWAGLLAGEKSYAAASRAYEATLRRWPGGVNAERALLRSAHYAVLAGAFKRAAKLIKEMRVRWPEGKMAVARDRTEVEIGEGLLAGATRWPHGSRRSRREAKAAYKVFAEILKRDRAGPIVERATLGRARALYRMNKIAKAISTVKVFLREFPRSKMTPEARRLLAAYRAGRVRDRSPERAELIDVTDQKTYIESHYPDPKGSKSKAGDAAIRRTFEAIAERQAVLKIEEARLYVRLKRPRAAEWVLRSVLRRYGDTRSAKKAAELLEELSEK